MFSFNVAPSVRLVAPSTSLTSYSAPCRWRVDVTPTRRQIAVFAVRRSHPVISRYDRECDLSFSPAGRTSHSFTAESHNHAVHSVCRTAGVDQRPPFTAPLGIKWPRSLSGVGSGGGRRLTDAAPADPADREKCSCFGGLRRR